MTGSTPFDKVCRCGATPMGSRTDNLPGADLNGLTIIEDGHPWKGVLPLDRIKQILCHCHKDCRVGSCGRKWFMRFLNHRRRPVGVA